MTPKQKRLLTPLSAPRWPRAPWPLNVIAAAVDGYYEAFFSVLIPPGYGGNHTKLARYAATQTLSARPMK